MQAIIMAGGEGTRLRPVTCSIPKPLAKLCAKPVLMYILDLLIKNGFDRATLTLMYKSEKIIEYFDNDKYKNMKLFYSVEEKPLGTAGSVKNAACEDEVLVISGDAMCDFELLKAIDFHRKNKADATIIVKKVSDPREFGLVLTDPKGRVTGFLEKPSYESCITDIANTGIYILSSSALDMIKKGEKLDFAQDIFPLMMNRNMKIYAYEDTGYWCDIGDIDTYRRCQKDILLGKVRCEINAEKLKDGNFYEDKNCILRGVTIQPPCYIGKNVTIGMGTVIKQGSVLCEGVTTGENVVIDSSVILDDAFLGDRVEVSNSVICSSASLLRDSSADDGSVIGEEAIIGESSTVKTGVKVWQGRKIEKYVEVNSNVYNSEAVRLIIEDDGIRGETNAEITPSVCVKLGSSLASLKKGSIIAIGRKGNNVSQSFGLALCSGAISSGGSVYDFEVCTEPQLYYCMKLINADMGCFIDGGETSALKVFAECGLPVTRNQERKIEAGLNRNEFTREGALSFGNYYSAKDIKELYKAYLKSILPKKTDGINIEIKCSDKTAFDFASELFESIRDEKGERLIVHLSSDSKKISIYTDRTGNVFYEKLVLLGCRIMFEKGEDVSLPYHFPTAAEKLAYIYGRKTERYYNCSCGSSDDKARETAKKCQFERDGVLLTVIILSYLAENNITFEKALEGLPEFYSACRYVSIKKPSAEVMKSICDNQDSLGEGVAVNDKAGRVLVRPVRSGKGVMMFVESFKSETASELCEKYERIIREKGSES